MLSKENDPDSFLGWSTANEFEIADLPWYVIEDGMQKLIETGSLE